ncbi:hypothetical protein [Nocardia paucivorans]|uniref:hypothetical protein n=1 Tax=Nocardia paucivorans TaxID=114259 RepID=UPI00031B062A|nr:hypothetical protein [Nocardia paucivorans]
MPTNSGEPSDAAPVPVFVPECRPVPESTGYASKVVRDLRYDGGLTIAIQGPASPTPISSSAGRWGFAYSTKSISPNDLAE